MCSIIRRGREMCGRLLPLAHCKSCLFRNDSGRPARPPRTGEGNIGLSVYFVTRLAGIGEELRRGRANSRGVYRRPRLETSDAFSLAQGKDSCIYIDPPYSTGNEVFDSANFIAQLVWEVARPEGPSLRLPGVELIVSDGRSVYKDAFVTAFGEAVRACRRAPWRWRQAS